ncbi:MAG: two-component response regulator, CheY-like domain protein [Herbinix sp.]|jgi:two-component system response regulator YesN|nr:two-component response regulator, CheY-like domain protein [Herbinix sp.]
MSGYSEKEYLKSAIHLRALSYEENPIDYDELEKVLAEAIHMIHCDRKKQEEAILQERLVKNFPLLKNEIALKLITNYQDTQPSFNYTLLGIKPESDFVTVVIQLVQGESLTNHAYFALMEATMEQLIKQLEVHGLTGITSVKDDHFILLHITTPVD